MPPDRWEASEPVAVPAAYAVVVEHLRRAIHLGHYAAGEKLPPERVLAPQLGVARVTLREALRVLEGEGYVQLRKGSAGGATVRERMGTPETLRPMLLARRDELQALQEFRVVNERLAVERAAARASDDDLALLEDTIERLRQGVSIGAFRQADSAFHLHIAAVADCRLLKSAVEEARAELFIPLDALDFEILLPETIREHERILLALQDRDAKRAGRAMVAHLKSTSTELDRLLRS